MYDMEIQDYDNFIDHLLEQASQDEDWDAEGSSMDALTVLE